MTGGNANYWMIEPGETRARRYPGTGLHHVYLANSYCQGNDMPANHLANQMSSVAYWYAEQPAQIAAPPPLTQCTWVLRDNQGCWLYVERNQSTPHHVAIND